MTKIILHCSKGSNMLQSYPAQLQGNQIIWLDAAPPAVAQPRQVVVVLDEPSKEGSALSISEILMRARGSLGHASREAVLSELAASRLEWDRSNNGA